MQPHIGVEFVASPFCFLDREGEFFIYLKYRLQHKEPITINTFGSIFDPAATFAENKIEILDTVSKEAVYSRAIPTHPLGENEDQSLVLKPKEGSYFFWTASSQPLRWREHSFDISSLFRNRRYIITYCNHGISQWYSGSYSTLNEARSDAEAQPGAMIQVNLVGNHQPQFSTRQAIPPLPPVTPSLTTSTPTCSLSGITPFMVSLTWRAETDRPIYALVTLKEGYNIGLEIRDPERNGRRIGPVPDLPPAGDDDPPNNDKERFVEFNRSGDSFSQVYTFATEKRRNGLVLSDTWNLKSGKVYELTLRKSRWRWMYQDEIEENMLRDQAKVVEVLRQEPYSEWKLDCQAVFEAQR